MGIIIQLVVLIIIVVFIAGLGMMVIGGICDFVKGMKTTTKNTSSASAAYYYDKMDEVMKKCFDENDKTFNWKLYFDEQDYFIHSGIPEVNKYLRDEFKYMGRQQIYYLNALIYQRMYAGEYEQLKRDLNAKEENIIRNLLVMCGGGESANCSDKIVRYRAELYNIMRGITPIPRTKDAVDKIVGCSRDVDW